VLTLGLIGPVRAHAQQSAPERLQFMGFRPGDPIEVLTRQATALGVERLTCDTARRDGRVRECRGTLYADSRVPLRLRAVAIRDTAAIVLVSGTIPEAERQRWERAFEAAYGAVPARVDGGQRMRQWIRNRTMLRLVWRGDPAEPEVSVSLVDGRTLDSWGRTLK
jgi:hypothetical protein